ncbi:MAG: GntR family transcriptional regulator [Eubacteriales bacterium]|nr:GntR family transcriptional regulator [Eubacteriales bacterium]
MSSVVENVYDSMRERILQGEFGPNDVFVELDIAEKYGVSRGTAREALQKLCESKFLIKMPRKGYFMYKFSPKEMADVNHLRCILETEAVKLSIVNAKDEEIRQLYQILEGPKNEKLPENTVNHQFHMSLARLSGNGILCDMLGTIIDISTRAAINLTSDDSKDSHKAIIEAVLARDVDMACQKLREDINS